MQKLDFIGILDLNCVFIRYKADFAYTICAEKTQTLSGEEHNLRI